MEGWSISDSRFVLLSVTVRREIEVGGIPIMATKSLIQRGSRTRDGTTPLND